MTTGNGTKVFIAGSRRLSKLSRDVTHRLDNMIEKGLAVLIGDANGVDKAVQNYFYKKRYPNVQVFCMEGGCRNNVGNWPTRSVSAANPSRRDFAYYSTKDRAMTDEADYGLMLWDGESRGTLTSIIDLVEKGKSVVVYFSPKKVFYTLRDSSELEMLLHQVGPSVLSQIYDHRQRIEKGNIVNHKSYAAPLF